MIEHLRAALASSGSVLTIRDGKIVDMQGCKSRREAMRFARRPSRSHGRPAR